MKPLCLAIMGCYFLLIGFPTVAIQESASVLDITLLPSYITGQVNSIGFFQNIEDEQTCEDLNGWFESTNSTVYFIPDDLSCIYVIESLGSVEAVSDQDGAYLITLPKALSEIPDLFLTVVAADILPDENLHQLPTQPWKRKFTSSNEDINFIIMPWSIHAEYTLIPILPSLQEHMKAQVLINGKISISNITDDRTYGALVNRPQINNLDGDIIISDIIMTYLDFPGKSFGGIYSGLQELNQQFNKLGIIVETFITEHRSALLDNETDNKISANVLGYKQHNSAPSDELCPTDNIQQRSASTHEEISLCITLGPADNLTLHFPNLRILSTSLPANQQPTPDTLIYSGPGRFPLTVRFERLPSSFIEQVPYFARRMSSNIADQLDAFRKNSPLPATLFTLTILLFVAFRLRLNPGYRVDTSLKIIEIFRVPLFRWPLFYLIYLVLGSLLLFWTPAASSLVLLSVVMISPYLKVGWNREFLVIAAIVIVIILDNIFYYLMGTNDFIYLQYTWIFFTLILTIILWGYFFRNETPDLTHIPAAIMVFFTIATHDVIVWSLPSLAIFLAGVFYFIARSQHIIIKTLIKTETSNSEQLMEAEQTSPKSSVVESQTNPKDVLVINTAGETNQPFEIVNPANWSQHLRTIATEPLLIIATFCVGVVIITSSNVPSLYTFGNNFLIITAIALLFACLYDWFKIGDWEPPVYIKAGIFMLLLLVIFFAGIGSHQVKLTGNSNISFALFLGKQAELLIGRVIFYLGVPLLIGVFIEYKKVKHTDPDLNIIKYVGNYRPIISIVGAILSILAPGFLKLISQQEALITLGQIFDQILKIPQ